MGDIWGRGNARGGPSHSVVLQPNDGVALVTMPLEGSTNVSKKKASDHLNIDTTGEKVGADQVAAKPSPGQ